MAMVLTSGVALAAVAMDALLSKFVFRRILNLSLGRSRKPGKTLRLSIGCFKPFSSSTAVSELLTLAKSLAINRSVFSAGVCLAISATCPSGKIEGLIPQSYVRPVLQLLYGSCRFAQY